MAEISKANDPKTVSQIEAVLIALTIAAPDRQQHKGLSASIEKILQIPGHLIESVG
ncbi:MAG TPA: hypothetical protein V6D18_08200 [Thermosynechococcaceae cyanobacterium]